MFYGIVKKKKIIIIDNIMTIFTRCARSVGFFYYYLLFYLYIRYNNNFRRQPINGND